MTSKSTTQAVTGVFLRLESITCLLLWAATCFGNWTASGKTPASCPLEFGGPAQKTFC